MKKVLILFFLVSHAYAHNEITKKVLEKNNTLLGFNCSDHESDLKNCLNAQFNLIKEKYGVELELCHDDLYRSPRKISDSKLFSNCLKRNLADLVKYEQTRLN